MPRKGGKGRGINGGDGESGAVGLAGKHAIPAATEPAHFQNRLNHGCLSRHANPALLLAAVNAQTSERESA